MRGMVERALRRKLAAAEVAGDDVRIAAIQARLGMKEAVRATPPAHVVEEPVVEVTDELEGVPFASSAAREAAKGMSAEAFTGRQQSSESGFTKADVLRIASSDGDE